MLNEVYFFYLLFLRFQKWIYLINIMNCFLSILLLIVTYYKVISHKKDGILLIFHTKLKVFLLNFVLLLSEDKKPNQILKLDLRKFSSYFTFYSEKRLFDHLYLSKMPNYYLNIVDFLVNYYCQVFVFSCLILLLLYKDKIKRLRENQD